MFISLGRKAKAPNTNKKAQISNDNRKNDSSNHKDKAWSQTVSPYNFFYPAVEDHHIQIVEDSLNPHKSHDFQERTGLRQRKKTYFEENAKTFEHFQISNLATVHKAFMLVVSEDGSINKLSYTSALNSLSVMDVGIVDRTFDLFDIRKDGIVEYKEIISALDVILNGTNKNITSHDCFMIVDPTGCGYVIKPCLHESKGSEDGLGDVNPLMVKRLMEIIDIMQEEMLINYQKDWAKKNKRRKSPNKKNGNKSTLSTSDKPAAGSIAKELSKRKKEPPPMSQKKIHLSYEEFCIWLSKDAVLVQSFLGQVLKTMENVYQRNKRATAASAFGHSQHSGRSSVS